MMRFVPTRARRAKRPFRQSSSAFVAGLIGNHLKLLYVFVSTAVTWDINEP
jgi:hypothetical protein